MVKYNLRIFTVFIHVGSVMSLASGFVMKSPDQIHMYYKGAAAVPDKLLVWKMI